MNQLADNDWARRWNLVRADTNLRKDVLHKGAGSVLELKFDANIESFVPVGDIPPAFLNATLKPRGRVAPDLESIGLHPLPTYSSEHEPHYVKVLDDFLIPYLQADLLNGDLQRLEAVIRIQCGWPKAGSRLAQLNPDLHFVNVDARIYQFKNGMRQSDSATSGNSTLLVIWAPDAPRQPVNSDGSAMGVS
jgi:hypothetical protein